MPRYKALIEYCGTNYQGWQKQASPNTIQGKLEDALFKFSEKQINVIGSSRTDTGVHALGQVAHFDLPKEYEIERIFRGINFYLQDEEISLLKVEKIPREFHSRALATHRHYQYIIINRPAPITLDKYKALWIPQKLDVKRMQEGAKFLIGHHDFSSFRSSECRSRSPIKHLTKLDIKQTEDKIFIYASANSFLHHMVRNIVGTLLLVGRNQIEPETIREILEAKSRSAAGPTSPAWGLYLIKVSYN
ncbi:tRNA pseudouridine synthase A [Candidatus Phycorickettsia trachydisci]|uniref:tRNA pseudouridine synthase A n=1 Tax=Candidatus Phycorickettsia trachydisci TaxID=2115978 RepID=A0A2P1P7Q3_9RICK|nr:tRNA pseudouridine(38-40) synthase TruA [Candidatus Phycorickettsia trachydisci]AVP87300.1 tRNA pseudouridine synthase A [Candidatus Phycorickettsia trachydisci]